MPKKEKNELILFLCFLFVLTGMTIGYASYTQLIQVEGVTSVAPQGTIRFTELTRTESSNVDTSKTPSFTDDSLDFNLHFITEDTEMEYMAKYQITVQNDTFYNQAFQEFGYSPIVYDSRGNVVPGDVIGVILGGISEGDKIPAGKSITFTATIIFTPTTAGGDYDVEGGGSIGTEEVEPEGNIVATLSGAFSGNLRGDNVRAPFTLSVINTHKTAQSFDILINNTAHYAITDINGTPLPSQTIAAGATGTFTFYVSRLNDVIFASDSETTGITVLSSSRERLNVGNVTLLVDKTEYHDVIPPTISSVILSMVRTEVGSASASWTAQDDVGATSYTVELYDSSNTLINTYRTVSDETSMDIKDLEAATYYVKVYGIDAAGNTASSQEIASCSENPGHCSRSAAVPMKWVFDINTSGLSGISSSGAATANLDTTYTTTLRATRILGSLPETITVTMGGRTLSTSEYTYTRGTGALSIPNVTGDITISGTATGGCLIEGTKVLLADGTSKNIEDVTYDDLVMIWNYETGTADVRHPIWIEIPAVTTAYQLITFSDGSELKTYGYHGVFSVDLNRFVSVDNPSEFNIGTKIYKLSKDKTLEVIAVKEIKTIHEKTRYYHVVSEKYYNIFANNILTTDGTVILSNLYGFRKNITWGESREKIISNPDNLYDYADFADFIPKRMFDGLRVREGKYLEIIGAMSKEDFIKYLKANQMNPEMFLPY